MDIHAEAQRLFDIYVAAYRTGDAAGCAAVFVIDGWLLSPYSRPAQGRAAIAEIHKAWTESEGSDKKEITVTTAGASGDLGWCLATYCESPSVEEGSSLNMLKRQADGRWLIRVCSINPNDAPLGG